MASEWWENFFSGVALDCWRQAVSDEQTRLEADFIEQSLGLRPPAKILDAPCGNGRLSLELAARGYQMTGIDIAREFLDEARSKSGERRLAIAWEYRDMRDLPWQAVFDGAFCFGNSFGYFDDSGNANFLKAVVRSLKSGARFVLEAAAAEIVLPIFEPNTMSPVGDILFIEENRYDHAEGRLYTDYTFVRNGKAEKRPGSQRIYTYRELSHLLEEAGFADIEAFGSLTKEPYKLGAKRLILAATKR